MLEHAISVKKFDHITRSWPLPQWVLISMIVLRVPEVHSYIAFLLSILAFIAIILLFIFNVLGIYTFCIHREIYHNIGSLLPLQDIASPKFAQLYIYDTEHEVQNRMNVMPFLDPTILTDLQQMLDQINPYVAVFRQVRDVLMQEPTTTLSMAIRANRTADPRCYNIPTANEVAAIIIGNEQETTPSHRDIVLSLRDGSLQRISELHRSYIPLHYVLLFPRGEDGWYPWIPLRNVPFDAKQGENGDEDSINDDVEYDDDGLHIKKRKHVTLMQFYAYRLQVRVGEGTGLHLAGRLFQQYIVDAYAIIEQNRLNFVRTNQKKIRSDFYQGKCMKTGFSKYSPFLIVILIN